MNLPWPGSKKAIGWLRRREASETFRHMAEMCSDLANALDTYNDAIAAELFARLLVKVAEAGSFPCFPARVVQEEKKAYQKRRRAA
jgi:hypothetical protein